MTGGSEQRCSRWETAEPQQGTALTDTRLLIVEQPGAWGRDAVADSGLDPRIWSAAAVDPGTRVLLARHPDRPRPLGRRRWWTLRAQESGITAAHGLLDWDDELTPAVWEAPPPDPSDDLGTGGVAPAVFLCTNGRRDICCAEFGRALLRQFPGEPQLWEVSHLGGHRFAPTALMVPSGMMLGRLDPDAVAAALTGTLPTPGFLRGRIGRSAQRQVAELAVAERAGVAADLVVSDQTGPDGVEVACPPAVAGDPWDWYQVRVAQHTGADRPKSCGAQPEPAVWWAPVG